MLRIKNSKKVVNMSITQKLKKCYKNQIENIKSEKNRESKARQIGSLVLKIIRKYKKKNVMICEEVKVK